MPKKSEFSEAAGMPKPKRKKEKIAVESDTSKKSYKNIIFIIQRNSSILIDAMEKQYHL